MYDAVAVLGDEAFDFVFTGIGALCWLPSISKWAGVVAKLLAPGGRLFLREGHPMLWTVDHQREDGLLAAEYPYFECAEPMVFDEPGTYVETGATFTHTLTHEWNHGLGEIVTFTAFAGLVRAANSATSTTAASAMPDLHRASRCGIPSVRDFENSSSCLCIGFVPLLRA